MTPTINVDEFLDGLVLAKGGHTSLEDGACLLEAASYVAGESWSDHPSCVSPVLGAFLRSFNDSVDDETRQRLKPLVPRILNTGGDKAADERRAWLATDWLVRVCAPAFLDLAGLTADASALRLLAPLDGGESARLAQPTITKGRQGAAAAWDAAGDAAWDAARAAAWDAAWDAARAAAGAAAWDAAGAAAWDAARAAAWAAAGAAARAKLQPTVDELQQSAFDLVERMIEAA